MSAAAPLVNWIGLWTIIRREWSRLMRVPIQAFLAPWISSTVVIFVFGFVVGRRIALIGGHRYIEFVLPGILMVNIVNAAFLQSSSQIYFARFLRYIEESLVAPLSYAEMIAGVIAVVVVRSVITGLGILLIATAFHATAIASLPEFLFWIAAVAMVFGLLGIVIGLWANNFEQLNMLNVFVITPLSYVGGMFNTVAMLPDWLRWLAFANPLFYFINGLRHAMIGYTDANEFIGIGIAVALAVGMSLTVWRLYAIGYGLRE